MKLKDTNPGDEIRVYCIGWRAFDDTISTVIRVTQFEVEMQNTSGVKRRFSPDCECLLVAKNKKT